MENMTTNQIRIVATALSIVFGSFACTESTHRSANDKIESSTISSTKRMADGKEWTTSNLNANASPTYCYDDVESNCRRYGRLYTWESAQRVCPLLGEGWRLPTDGEWQQMAKYYGGVSADSADKGRAAFAALLSGGTSGFNAVLGGNRSDGKYARLEAHGFYWTASDNDPDSAPYYNFGQNGQALHRQPQGEKQMAISVRCVRE
jgi:uncharacterized protein (TIGR02145 family)